MSWRVIAGDNRYWNYLARCAGVFVTPAADANFPLANIWDGRPDKVFRFGSAAGVNNITLDGQLLTNGLLDTWTGGGATATGWTENVNGAGSDVVETTTAGEVVNGSAAKITCGSGALKFAELYQDFLVRAGEQATVGYSIRGSGATGIVRVRLQNLVTGRHYAAGHWVSTVTDLDSRTAATHLASKKTFTVEDFGVCLRDTMLLRLSFRNDDNSASTNGFVDEVEVFPSVDVVSFHGHTISAGRLISLRSDSDPTFLASPIVHATFGPSDPAFYYLLPSKQAYRYWRIENPPMVFSTGNDTAIPEIGEAILGQTTAPTRQPNFPVEFGEMQDDNANDTPAGASDVTKLSKHVRRTVGLHFDYRSHAEWEEVRDIQRRAGGRTFPTLLIPDSTRPEVVLGKLDRSWRAARSFNTIYSDGDLMMAELPFAASTL